MKLSSYICLSVFASLATLSSEEVNLNEDPRDLLEHTDAYIKDKQAKLMSRTSKLDIFGLPQNLKEAEAKRAVVKRAVVKRKVGPPLDKILSALTFTLTDPIDNRVVFEGGATLRAGELLEVNVSGQIVKLRLDDVSSRGSHFTNVETGERGIRSSKKLARGISFANGRTNAPKEIQKIGGSPRTHSINIGPITNPDETSSSNQRRPSALGRRRENNIR